MRILKSFIIAVSMYSKIPVPQFAWKEEDMKHIFCFFPWIGAWIGLGIYFWNYVCDVYQVGALCRMTVELALPLLITGGIHVDGFMDTMDAVHSYRSKEQKLEILKDSHIGAFAVIMLVTYGLLISGMLSEIKNHALLKIVCGGFFLSRCLCGISAVSFPLAKTDGMLYHFVDTSHKRIVRGVLYLQSAVCIGFMMYCDFLSGLFTVTAALFSLLFYFYYSRKEFGGITGDTAGFFLVFCEGCMITVAACMNILRF